MRVARSGGWDGAVRAPSLVVPGGSAATRHPLAFGPLGLLEAAFRSGSAQHSAAMAPDAAPGPRGWDRGTREATSPLEGPRPAWPRPASAAARLSPRGCDPLSASPAAPEPPLVLPCPCLASARLRCCRCSGPLPGVVEW